MRKEYVGEVDQLVGFSYFSSKDQKLRRIYATDMFKGALISSKANGGLEDLIYPYSLNELENALEKSGRKQVLNPEILGVVHSGVNAKLSKVYRGFVGSMSFEEVPVHFVNIRNAHDFERVEMFCDCKKQSKRRYASEVRAVPLKRYWNLKENPFSESTCPHICAVDSNLRKTTGANIFGLSDGLNYIKPYLLSYIDFIKRFPKLPDYVPDFAYAYKSSMFGDAKKQINDIRRKNDLNELEMYSNPYLKTYIIDKMGVSEEVMKEIVGIVGY